MSKLLKKISMPEDLTIQYLGAEVKLRKIIAKQHRTILRQSEEIARLKLKLEKFKHG